MLIYEYFDGDSIALAQTQHEVYGEALNIIIAKCKGHVDSQRTLPRAETVKQVIDHRTLQVAHDIVAAAWRHAVLVSDQNISEDGWLGALAKEVDAWVDQPRLIFLICCIMDNQNCETGYEAEDALRDMLIERYRHICFYSSINERHQW